MSRSIQQRLLTRAAHIKIEDDVRRINRVRMYRLNLQLEFHDLAIILEEKKLKLRAKLKSQ